METKYDAPIDTALEYGVDLRFMLISNLAPHLGLANGTQGIIRDNISEVGIKPPHPPKALVIEIDSWKGESFHQVHKK